MGCTPSRSEIAVDIAKVAPATAAGAPIKFQEKEPVPEPKAEHNEANEPIKQSRQGRKKEKEEGDSSSARSLDSSDSGIAELEEEYSHVITEFSLPEKIEEIEQNFVESPNFELEVVGVACPRKLSSKDKERAEEQNILSTLREEGLVPRPLSKVNGGLKFEIVSSKGASYEFSGLRKLPPLSLQKALTQKKTITKEDIEEKLERAEERRKLQEEEKLGKLITKGRKEDVLMTIEQQSQEIKERHSTKMEAKAKLREEKLKELQCRLHKHQKHAERVRHRKNLISVIPDK